MIWAGVAFKVLFPFSSIWDVSALSSAEMPLKNFPKPVVCLGGSSCILRVDSLAGRALMPARAL
eukprot:CAMPEP_0177746738 /NCGR_PEP_ID=MMETSP0484_2-20121128/31026_1 /TAXON_ID=354590 /ORGANISM="Rhodomonas lens, Strain RHODO" /LENGTH=63 /DNA_ID=CAMNT_0019261501 /DNA_START=24 /DNA_END=212 /DNA_ORIENTATION=+